MISTRLSFRIATAEISNTGHTGGDFARWFDPGDPSVWLGLIADYDNQQFIVYEQGVTANQVVVDVIGYDDTTLIGFTINLLPITGSTLLRVNVYHGGTFWGSFNTVNAQNISRVRFGVMAHNSQPVDRYFRNVIIGTAGGRHDLFTDTNYSGGSIIPPWDSTFGSTLVVSGIDLRVHNAGAVDAYAEAILPVAVPPPPPVVHIDPDPTFPLTFVGDPTFQRSGSPRWQVSGWDLDKVVIPMSGKVTALNDYINSLVLWSQWSEDTNMFLSEFPQDDHKQFPTVNLVFLGKKGGVLPPARQEELSSLQHASGIVFSDSFILTFGLPPHWEARLTYVGPITRSTQWFRGKPDVNDVSAPEPVAIGPDDIASLVLGGIDYAQWTAAAGNYASIVAWVLRWFVQRTATYASIQEMVPSGASGDPSGYGGSGGYWRAQITKQALLFPVQESIV